MRIRVDNAEQYDYLMGLVKESQQQIGTEYQMLCTMFPQNHPIVIAVMKRNLQNLETLRALCGTLKQMHMMDMCTDTECNVTPERGKEIWQKQDAKYAEQITEQRMVIEEAEKNRIPDDDAMQSALRVALGVSNDPFEFIRTITLN